VRKTAISLFVALSLLPAICGAQEPAQEPADGVCPKRPPAEKRAQRWAGRWFAKGEAAAKDAKFPEALDAFLCSLHLYPHQNTVFNVAQLTNLVEDKAATTATLKSFRAENPDDEFDGELADLIVSLEKAQGIEPAPEPAAAPSEPEPEPEPPPIVAPNEPEPAAEAVEPEEPPSPAAKDPQADGTPKGRALRVSGFVAIGTAGATLVTAIVLQAMAGAAKGDAEDATTYAAFRAREDDMKGRQTGATVMFVATGVLAGVGALMLGLGRSKKEDAGGADVEVTAAIGPAGFAVEGRF
jgi:hypothetical protein